MGLGERPGQGLCGPNEAPDSDSGETASAADTHTLIEKWRSQCDPTDCHSL